MDRFMPLTTEPGECATCHRPIGPLQMCFGRMGDKRQWCESCGIPRESIAGKFLRLVARGLLRAAARLDSAEHPRLAV